MPPTPNSPSNRAADWLESQMNPDGSLRGATSINEYYKAVVALTCAGRHAAAERMFNHIVVRFLQKNGDLDGTGCPWYRSFRIYCHGWVAMAAIQLARFDISERILGFIEGFHDPGTGGFFGTLKDRDSRGEQEMMTTGVLAIAMLWEAGSILRDGSRLGSKTSGRRNRIWSAAFILCGTPATGL